MKKIISILLIFVFGLSFWVKNTRAQGLSSALFPVVSKASRAGASQRPVESPTDLNRLLGIAREHGTVRLIIGFKVDNYKPDPELAPGAQRKQRDEINLIQTRVLERMSNFYVKNPKLFEYIPFMALETTAEGLQYLRGSSDVTFIKEDEVNYAMLPQSIPILGGSPFGGASGGTFGGFSGAGRTVAILDTGVDKAHPFFNNRVVSEACYSTTGGGFTSYCPGGAASSTAVGSGVNCPMSVDGCGHGTHVAGIAAGGSPLITGNGVARNANIIAIQVFSRTTSCGTGPSPCTSAVTSDVIAALNRVYALRTTFNIDSVNMSLGSGRYFNYCDTEQADYKAAIDLLRSAGIVTIAASGNDGYSDSISTPACVSSAISVGSTNDGDAFPIDFVSTFSNAALMLNLLAPGEVILSSVPGGTYDIKQGTSMAAPMVAGAWAVMKEKYPSDTIAQTLTRLRYSGVQVLDSRQGLVKPRIKIDTALNTSSTDPCNSATAITFGQTVNAAFANSDCLMLGGSRADLYTFSGTQGQGIAITQSSTAFFTYLFLLGPSGNVIGQNGGGLTSRIPTGSGFMTLPATGTYTIIATSVEGNRFGNYTINLATNGCSFGISSTSASVGAGAGSGNFNLTTTAGCTWSAQSNAAWLTTSSTGNGSGTVNYNFTANTGAQRTGTITAGGQSHTVTQAAGAVAAKALFDFDGDRKADISVFRPSSGIWYLQRSQAGETAVQFGASADKIAPADYDGDGKTDIAVFRASQGVWYIFNSSTGTSTTSAFGVSSDLPAPGDYDGDGKADVAIYRPSTGAWWLNRSTAGLVAIQFGLNGDIPVPGDFDGDGKADLVVFRPSNGIWYMQRSTAGGFAIQFGNATDKVAPADYDGDGKMDVAIYRPSQGTWYIVNSSNGGYPVQVFGLSTDIPVPGDYDGDGKADVGIFRPSNGQWWLNRTTSGLTVVQFGSNGDKPTQSAFGN